jgi:hypothetical protein
LLLFRYVTINSHEVFEESFFLILIVVLIEITLVFISVYFFLCFLLNL